MTNFFCRWVITRAVLVFIGIAVAILIAEISSRFIFSSIDNYYIWPPYFHATFNPLPNIMPGINQKARFIVNSKGLRGDEMLHGCDYRILTIGGSTTECGALDQFKTWQYLLQKKLNQAIPDYKIWIGNAGKSGNTSEHHILQLKYLVPQYHDLDVVVILLGINDLTIRLSKDIDYRNYLNNFYHDEEILLSAFMLIPWNHKSGLPFYKKTAIWHICKRIRYLIFSVGQIQDDKGESYVRWRCHRRDAKVIRDVLPDMPIALKEYSRNVNALIDSAKEKGIRLIFMTQPVLWKPGLSEELNDLLWLGGVGNFQKEPGKEYYLVEALSDGMKMYNETLLRICKDRQVECIDIASILPKDTSVFYDDCHFNESGSEKVAEIIAQYMLQHKPFKE